MKMNNYSKLKDITSPTLPNEFLEEYALKIFTPLFRGECVTSIFVMGGGKRTVIKYLIKNKELIEKYFPNMFENTLYVFVNFDEIIEFSNYYYLDLIKKKIYQELTERNINLNLNKKDENNPLMAIEEVFEKLVALGWRIFLVLNDFELTLKLSPSIYLNLEHLLSIDKSRIEYLFLTTLNVLDPGIFSSFHNLKYALTRNVVFFPLLEKKNVYFLIDKVCQNQLFLKKETPPSKKELLYKLCGGHPQLLRYSLYFLKATLGDDFFLESDKKIEEKLLSSSQNLIICADIWNSLREKEKETMFFVLRNGNFPDEPQSNYAIDYLIKLHLVKKEGKKVKIFGKIFERFLLNFSKKSELFYDEKTKKIFYGEKSCEEIFTHQEFKVLTYLIQHKNQLVTRDEIAKTMWGSLYYQEKYSDWAIDKIISTIRRKLDSIGFSSQNLITLKKRGFILKDNC